MFYNRIYGEDLVPVKCIFKSSPVALAVVRSQAVVMLLLIYCLLSLQLFVGVQCLVLLLLFSTLCPFSFATILMGEDRELVAIL